MEFTYTGIRVRDAERSIKFYTEVMNMKVHFFETHKDEGKEWGVYSPLK
jgi:catechol 2,3-dioxygenase-like lactoylglutathione lyase family enzyme